MDPYAIGQAFGVVIGTVILLCVLALVISVVRNVVLYLWTGKSARQRYSEKWTKTSSK